MTTTNKAEQYKVEYTDILGAIFYSEQTNLTREYARWIVRNQKVGAGRMFHTGRRACLKDCRVVKA